MPDGLLCMLCKLCCATNAFDKGNEEETALACWSVLVCVVKCVPGSHRDLCIPVAYGRLLINPVKDSVMIVLTAMLKRDYSNTP